MGQGPRAHHDFWLKFSRKKNIQNFFSRSTYLSQFHALKGLIFVLAFFGLGPKNVSKIFLKRFVCFSVNFFLVSFFLVCGRFFFYYFCVYSRVQAMMWRDVSERVCEW